MNGGKLLINGYDGGGGPIDVNSEGYLGGAGAILGNVTIHNGAHIAPGTVSNSLELRGALTLEPGADLDFKLNTVGTSDTSDYIDVIDANDNFVINGGTVNISNEGAMTTGTYKLIYYAGTINSESAT